MKPKLAQRPRIAIIGVSGYGRIHFKLARDAHDRGEVQVVAATVINPVEETEAVQWLRTSGATIHSEYGSMLDAHRGQIDLCLIPTGIHWHARMTCAALKAGCNVLVEKPLAATAEQAAEICAAEKASGKFVAVGFQDIYEPATRWLERELASGVIGKLESVRFLGCWPRPRSYYLRNNWAGRLRVGDADVLDSPLNNAFAHFVMLSLYFLGADGAKPLVLENVELMRAHCIESFDTAVVQARSAAGVRLWFGATHASHQTIEPEIQITGSHGQARWRYEIEAGWENDAGRTDTKRMLDITGARQAMFDAALQRLSIPTTFICTSELALRHTRLIADLHRFAEITTISPELIKWSDFPDASVQVPEISGLPEALSRAYREHASLADAGLKAKASIG